MPKEELRAVYLMLIKIDKEYEKNQQLREKYLTKNIYLFIYPLTSSKVSSFCLINSSNILKNPIIFPSEKINN